MVANRKLLLGLLLTSALLLTISTADRGCPDNQGECDTYCGGPGRGACERRWYRWRYRPRCICQPCRGQLVLGLCVTSVGVNYKCDGNGNGCGPRPTGSIQTN